MKIKKIVAMALTFIMLMGIVPIGAINLAPKASAKKDISSYSVGDTITYGSYPQSRVTDSSLISALETAGNKYMWVSYNYYSGTGTWDDGKMQPDEDMMWYKDIPYNGNVYRAVWIKKYRPYCTGYTSSSNEQQSNGYYTGNVYYFRYDPLTWRVLDPAEGFVMCTTAIDAQAYNNYIIYNSSNGEYYGNSAKTYYASDWANSSLRYWLNNDFYSTAFSSTEKSQIGTTYNENKSRYNSKYDSADTSDKLFLLSYNEVLNSKYGFSSSYSTYDPARQLKSTDYAQCQGCYKYTSTSCYGNSWWRLRSPYYSSYAAGVSYDGYAGSDGTVDDTGGGIVPAFKFNPKSTIQNLNTYKMVNSEVAMECDFEYSDEFFNASAYTYNHKMAIASCCLATAAMVKDGEPFNNPESAKNMLNAIGFGNDNGEGLKYYGYTKSPTMNSIACVIANKNVGDTTVISVAVRGGGYEGEWAGNFNVGTETNHKGFNLAKQQVCDNLMNFINTYKSSFRSNIKFWITGYSRSAATANLVASNLNKKELDGTTTNYSLSSLNYSAKDVFAYCFETPRNTTDKNAKAATYNNIFNIVNRIDPVPRVAPAKWDYVRYGKDCYLPSKEITERGLYKNLTNRVYTNFDIIYTGKKDQSYQENFTFYEIKTNVKLLPYPHPEFEIKENRSISQGVFLDNLIGYLADGLKSSSYYASHYQDGVTKAVYKIKGNIKYDEILQKQGFWDYLYNQLSLKFIATSLIPTQSVFEKLIIEALCYYFADAGMTRDEATDIAMNLSGVLSKLIVHPNYLLTAVKNGAELFIPHYTETTLAWLVTLNGDYAEAKAGLSKMLTGGESYRVATVNCPVNVKVYDSNGVLCGSIVDNEVQYIEDGISVYINENGEKCFCLPGDEEFRFEYTGYDEGTMNCSFADCDIETGEKINSTNYYGMPVSNGTKYTGLLEEKDGDTSVSYIYDKNNNKVNASETIDYEVAEKYTVSASADENGNVLGGGEFYKGEFVELFAIANDGYMFDGWYNGSTKVSSELDYRFMVDKNVTLVAKFSVIPRINVSSDSLKLKVGENGTVTYSVTKPADVSVSVSAGFSVKDIASYKNENGKITFTGLKAGTTKFGLQLKNKTTGEVLDTKYVTITVESKGGVKSVSVGGLDLNYKGSGKLNPKVETEGNVKYTVEYKSSDNGVATVDKNGNVYGAKSWGKKTATVTCTVTDEFGNVVTGKCNVTVGYAWWQWIIGIVLFGWIWY